MKLATLALTALALTVVLTACSAPAAEQAAHGRAARDHRRRRHGRSIAALVVLVSEIAGAKYDTVISLAGAYKPDGWEPDPDTRDTEYAHHSYIDWLELAHKADNLAPDWIVDGVVPDGILPGDNLVGSGDFPSENPAFDKHFYSSKYDDALVPEISFDLVKTGEEIAEAKEAWLANHELVHQSGKDNAAVIADVKEDIYG